MINIKEIEKLRTFSKDKRISIKEFYKSLNKLNKNLFEDEIIYFQKSDEKRKIKLPILGFKTKKSGKAIWIIAGVHGEEPAGPNALIKNISLLNNLAKSIPLVLIPLANPAGYWRDWRYPNQKRARMKWSAPSVGNMDHLVINDKTKKAFASKPLFDDSKYLGEYIIKNSKTRKPFLVLDLHEDESLRKLYLYSHVKNDISRKIGSEIVKILKKSGFEFYEDRKTTFDEEIKSGIVESETDGSLDDLLASKKIFTDGRISKGPSAKTVIVVETTTKGFPLKKRVHAHSLIIKQAEKFYKEILESKD